MSIDLLRSTGFGYDSKPVALLKVEHRMTIEMPTSDDRPMWQLWLSTYWLPAVTAATELNVFESLAQAPAAYKELASRLGLSEHGLEVALPLYTALGLLVQFEGRYQLTDIARLYLLRTSPLYWGGVLDRWGPSSPHHASVRDALRFGRPTSTTGRRDDRPSDSWARGQIDLQTARGVASLMHSHSLPAALGMARNIDLKGVRRLLDVGGGSGCFCIGLAQRHADLRCTIMELPAMCEVALEYVAAAGLSDRIDARAVDMFRQDWPHGYDALFFSNVLHDWDFETCASLLAKAHAVLPRGGQVLVHEQLLDESGTGPLVTTTFSLLMLLGTEGRQFTFVELKELLQHAGFGDVAVTPSYGYYSVVRATRP